MELAEKKSWKITSDLFSSLRDYATLTIKMVSPLRISLLAGDVEN